MTDSVLQNFIRNGYVILNPDYPEELHRTIHKKTQLAFTNGNPGNQILEQVPELHQIFDHVEIQQALNKLIGDNYIMHPHRHCHVNPPNSKGQNWHQDGTPRQFSGWNHPWRRHHHLRLAMAFYYPHHVSEMMGGTGIIPNSQYYNSNHSKDNKTEFKITGCSGTVAIVHYDIWHRATINSTNSPRYMMKFLFQRCVEPSVMAIGNWQPQPSFDQSVTDYHWHWFHQQDRNWGNYTTRSVDSTVELLINQLSGDCPGIVRTESIYQLAKMGAQAVGALMNGLQNIRSEKHRLNIATALSAIGESAIPVLGKIVSDSDDWWLRATAADILGDIGKPATESLLVLIQSLSDESEWVRRNATYALGTVATASSEAIPALILATKDDHSFVRINALKALLRLCRSKEQQNFSFSEVTIAYQNALKDKDSRVVEYAQHCLQFV